MSSANLSFVVLALLCATRVSLARGWDAGEFHISVDGVQKSFRIVGLNESRGLVRIDDGDRKTLTLTHGVYGNASETSQGTRIWASKSGRMESNSYAYFDLLNKTLSYSIDMSNVPCSCNAALFWVTMPGYSKNGHPAPSRKGNYYCDANKVWGTWCWEFDSIEGNSHVMKVTPHTCNAPPGGYIGSCDRSGPFLKGFSPKDSLCPSSSCTVDTRRPFTHTQKFRSNGTHLVAVENIVSQGILSFSFGIDAGEEYLAKMTDAMKKMVLTFQLWGDSWLLMSWLDGLRCLGSCPHNSTVTYSNMSIY